MIPVEKINEIVEEINERYGYPCVTTSLIVKALNGFRVIEYGTSVKIEIDGEIIELGNVCYDALLDALYLLQ